MTFDAAYTSAVQGKNSAVRITSSGRGKNSRTPPPLSPRLRGAILEVLLQAQCVHGFFLLLPLFLEFWERNRRGSEWPNSLRFGHAQNTRIAENGSELPGIAAELPPELPGRSSSSAASSSWGHGEGDVRLEVSTKCTRDTMIFGWLQQGPQASCILAAPCFCAVFIDFGMVQTFRPNLPISGRV